MRQLKLTGATVLFAVIFTTCPPVLGQYLDIEPNQPCIEAQRLDADPGLAAVEILGEVTQYPDSEAPGDRDYFHLEAVAGTPLRADLLAGEATSPLGFVPYLGLFDEQCSALDFDSHHYGIDARIDFAVPDSGQFILGVNSVTDPDWSGQHGQAGFYTLLVAEPEPPIGGIRGRLVDGVSGDSVAAGTSRPYVVLYRCGHSDCSTPVKYENAGRDGQFLIESGELGPLDPGDYLLQAFAVDYETALVGPFTVQPGELKDLGDIALQPPTFALGTVFPCAELGAEGGLCNYSVQFNNNSEAGVSVRSWSLAQAVAQDEQGLYVAYLEFPTHPRFRTDWVDARSTVTLHFSFNVPPATPDHLHAICPQVLVADAATQFSGVLRWSQLFCVIKRPPGFDVVNREQVLRLDGLNSWWLTTELEAARAVFE